MSIINQLQVPGCIHWNTPEEFCEETLSALKGKRLLLFISSSSAERLSLKDWINELNTECFLTHIDKIPANPTYMDAFNALKSCGSSATKAPEVVVAVGGGSAIDMAKACAALWYLKDKGDFDSADVLSSIRSKEYLKCAVPVPIYAVPTTAGTGSEVTRWATVWDNDNQAKYSVEAPWLCPKQAYIVPEYTATMPVKLTLSTGLDALCHAVEAYWARSGNPMVREMSKTSIRLIVEHLPKVLSELDNMHYRRKMCLGSLYAGLSFANTRTTACHSISYPLTMVFGMDHGLACAVSLPKVMETNLPVIDDADELLSALNVSNPEDLQQWINNVTDGIVELRLSTFGVQEKDIDQLVKLSFTQGRMDNNPVDIKPDDVKDILYKLL